MTQLLLAGIVLRGAGFAFHSYRLHDDGEPGRWRAVFAASSLLSPVLLGVTIGALSSAKIRTDSLLFTGDTSAWLAPFPLSVGLLTLAIFSYIAAVYLILETPDPGLQDDFRARALWSAAASAFLSVLVPVLARSAAPDFYRALTGSDWSVPLVILTGTSALGAYVALHLRVFSLARACAALRDPVHIQVFVTPTCPYCPCAVVLAHKLAMASELVTADMVEATEFPHLANKYHVHGVPRTVVNETIHIEGAVPEAALMSEIMANLEGARV